MSFLAEILEAGEDDPIRDPRTKGERMILSLAHQAIAGDVHSIRLAWEMIEAYDEVLAASWEEE